MSSPLVVTGEHPLPLDGLLDSSISLQIKHREDELSDHSQTIHAKHDNLNSPSGTIQVKIADFASGGDNWEISVTHVEGGTSTTWSRSSNHAHHDFAAMTDALEVDVTATSDASPSQSKTRKIWIKTMPADGQPDRL